MMWTNPNKVLKMIKSSKRYQVDLKKIYGDKDLAYLLIRKRTERLSQGANQYRADPATLVCLYGAKSSFARAGE